MRISLNARNSPMMPGAKVINHDALAHEWLYDLMTRPNMRIKVGYIPHDIRILGRIVEVRSTKQSVWHLFISISLGYQGQKKQTPFGICFSYKVVSIKPAQELLPSLRHLYADRSLRFLCNHRYGLHTSVRSHQTACL